MAAPVMMVLNPRTKRRRRRPMTAKQRKYFGKRKRKTVELSVNPRRKSRRKSRKIYARRNPVARSRTRRRSSTLGGGISQSYSSFTSMLIPAGIGAASALALDAVLAQVDEMLPAELTTGIGGTATRIAGAIGAGYVARRFGGRKFGNEVMAGALIVVLYDAGKALLETGTLGGYDMGWIAPAQQVGDAQMYPLSSLEYSSGVGEYVGDYDSDEIVEVLDMNGGDGLGMYVGN